MKEFSMSPTIWVWIVNALILVLFVVIFWRSGNKMLAGSIMGLSYILVAVFMMIPAFYCKVVVTDNTVIIKTPPYPFIIYPISNLQVLAVDLSKDTPLKPKARTGGTGLFNYRLGSFRLANGKDAALMIKSDECK